MVTMINHKDERIKMTQVLPSAINQLPSIDNIKDFDSKFIAMSAGTASLIGFKSSEDAIGKSDYDIPCGVSEFADDFIRLDRMVLRSGERMVAIDVQKYKAGWGLLLSEKKPLFDENNKAVAIYSNCIDLSSTRGFNGFLELYTIDTKLLGKRKKPASYVLSGGYSPFSLTKKQENCLFYLIRGKSIKEIGKILNISSRTVESHLDAIKLKLNCFNKAEIIEKALDSGFLFYVPVGIQKEYKR